MGELAQRLRRAFRRYGAAGMARQSFRLLVSWPSRRRYQRMDREFDARHAVDTAGVVRLQKLDIRSDNREHGVRYEATNPAWFRELVSSLPIDHSDFVFVDFGSGKGRALLLASEYPFARIVGVEFAPQLAAVARRNLDGFRSERQRCRDFELVCVDAVDYAIPDEPLVLYFYNPFAEPVLRRVLEGVRRSLESSPRTAYALVTGDAPLGLFTAAGFRPQSGVHSDKRGQRIFAWAGRSDG